MNLHLSLNFLATMVGRSNEVLIYGRLYASHMALAHIRATGVLPKFLYAACRSGLRLENFNLDLLDSAHSNFCAPDTLYKESGVMSMYPAPFGSQGLCITRICWYCRNNSLL